MTESEVPTLGLGTEQRQMWTQAVMTMAYGVRERRHALGQVAWSDERTADRTHERTKRIADPRVRAMSVDEWTEAVDRRQRGQGDERHTDSGSGWVTVWLGPLDDGRTALLASAGPPDSPTPTATAAASCADTATAMELAEDLLVGGPERVDRLHAFATLSMRRARAAASDVAEPEPVRLARTAAAVRQVWTGPRYTALAEAVVASPAFPALAWRLHELAERGYAFADVLGGLDPDRLIGSTVRDPAALAEWFVEQRARDLRVVNLDPDDTATVDPADRVRGATQAGRSAAPRVDAAAAAAEEAVVAPLLAAAYPPELVQRLQHGRGYPRLRGYLHELHQQGRPVAKTLAAVAAARLEGAHDPASYLHAAVNRHPLTAPLRPTGPDRAAMAELVRTALPDSVADKVLACRAWPVLARRLGAWSDAALPVADLLADLPAGRVFQARTPAAYIAHLMDLKVAAHRISTRAAYDARTRVRGETRRTGDPAAAALPETGTTLGPHTAGPDTNKPDRPASISTDSGRTRLNADPRQAPAAGDGPADLLDAEDRDLFDDLDDDLDTDLATRWRERPRRGGPDADDPTRGRRASPDTPGGNGLPDLAPRSSMSDDEQWLIGDYVVVDRAVTDADVDDPAHSGDVGIVVDVTVLWSEDLDPATAVDRVGLEATVGLGSAGRADQLEARLDDAQAACALGTSGAAAPRAVTAAAAAGLLTTAAWAAGASPAAPPSVDPHTAAAARAAAAEQRGDPAAAAARAEVTCTPPTAGPAEHGARGPRRVTPPVSPPARHMDVDRPPRR